MSRIKCLDLLKSIAILGVVLFHSGFIKNGYLGVEIFFVVSGYLFVHSVKKDFDTGDFNPIMFLTKKLSAFLPIVAIAGGGAILLGSFIMLPDDLENLSESIIASNVFANNILQAITTRNYWNVVNTYKPLMHTWYIAVIMQSFCFLALVLWLASKKISLKTILIVVTILSFLLYLAPFFSNSDKFYMFPFRLFEITIGGLVAYIPKRVKMSIDSKRLIGNLGILTIMFLLFANFNIINSIGLLFTILASVVIIWSHVDIKENYGMSEKISSIIVLPGIYSLDIYIWHQIVIAFLLYAVFTDANVYFLILVLCCTSLLSYFSVWLRKNISLFSGIKKRLAFSIVIVMLSSVVALCIYFHAGVVRDIPELDIDMNNVHRHMHAEYVDGPYLWNHDFKEENKIHILVIGDSFARDFANVINESTYHDDVEISYIYGADLAKYMKRIDDADYVFYSANSWEVPDSLSVIPNSKLYIVGRKLFGKSNGIFFANRDEDTYFEQRFTLPDDFILHNNAFKGRYGKHYVDMISPLLDGNNIRIFTDDGFFISQDCLHLTKNGAKYYSRVIDWDGIVSQ